MSVGPFPLRVSLCFTDPVSVTIALPVTRGKALVHNLHRRNTHSYPELCLFVVFQTHPSEILPVT